MFASKLFGIQKTGYPADLIEAPLGSRRLELANLALHPGDDFLIGDRRLVSRHRETCYRDCQQG
jgi:hypothetical protein